MKEMNLRKGYVAPAAATNAVPLREGYTAPTAGTPAPQAPPPTQRPISVMTPKPPR